MAPPVEPIHAAVLGYPVGHSLSPRLHGYWLKEYGIKGDYRAIEVKPEALENFLRTLPAQGFAGVNLTVPLKEKALPLMHGLDALARRIGAVNTVVAKGGKLHGTNTDAYGFMAALKAKMKDLPAGNALVLGAGGAARAVCVGLADAGWNIALAGRTQQKAERIANQTGTNRISVVDWEAREKEAEHISLLVNTTTLGMKGQPVLDMPLEGLPRTAWVCDIVYAREKTAATGKYASPIMTDLLARAQDRGLAIVEGLGMLLYQAQPAFEAWFGVRPDVNEALFTYMLKGL